jgi:outer membrane protein, heavy metal efflux system
LKLAGGIENSMKATDTTRFSGRAFGLGALLALLALAGCRGFPGAGERAARQDLKTVAQQYRPDGRRPELPALEPGSSLSNFLAFALLNSPQVESAYYTWAASVERITVERSLPDPQITFQSDIAEVLQTVMPGFMMEFPGPGKLKARAGVATAGSRAQYFAFESAVLQAAYDVKRTGYELRLLDDRLRINRQTLALLDDLERIARTQNEVGKGTLQDVLRARIERDRVENGIANLEDSRGPRMAAFRAALGLRPGPPDPPVPGRLDSPDTDPNSPDLLPMALARNPRLKAMEAEVRAAEAGITLAYREKVPDFSLGLMADAKATPTMFRPLAGMTLPVWRDKLAAEVARARAEELAAQARLDAGQIELVVEFAEKSFACRELGRNVALLRDRLIPKARQSLELARAGYLSGTIDFFNLINAQQTLLDFELGEVEARTQRGIALAQLSLIVAGVPPAGAPLLPALAAANPK